jgi:hypothetical protein
MLPCLSCVKCCVCLPFPFVFIRVLPGSCPISFEKSFFRFSRPNVHPTCCCSAAPSDIALDYAGRQLISIDGGCIFMVTGSKLCKYYLSGLDYRDLLCPIIKSNMRDQSKITFIAASQASGVKLRSSEAGKLGSWEVPGGCCYFSTPHPLTHGMPWNGDYYYQKMIT